MFNLLYFNRFSKIQISTTITIPSFLFNGFSLQNASSISTTSSSLFPPKYSPITIPYYDRHSFRYKMPSSSSSPTTSLPRQFSLSDITSATNNFSTDLIIGTGSFGTVYKATIDPIATTVAVKRRCFDSKLGPIEFWAEVNLLLDFRHTHLISLIGYYFDHDHENNEMILVYEYMDNGTLSDHIYKSNVNSTNLSWEQRVKICIGVARGVEYLHTGMGIDKTVIHRDLKSSNILLDADWVAKISDFGLSQSCSTFLETKLDVYAFGVVLLEVLCGRRSLDFEVLDMKKLGLLVQECIREGNVHRIIDPGLKGTIADDGLCIFLDITMKCLLDCAEKRPTMVEVVGKLDAVLASQYTSCSSFSSEDDEFVKIYFSQGKDR